ncbi:MAG: hypothetical protein SOZ79_11150 [Candidatus Ventricola sp.]|nr:hypothetical protein [Candidatus Ventricola sp.]
MGKSFVLKDAAGRPGGYLTQGMREICCRADAQAQQAVLLFEDGTAEERPLCGGQEARWPDDGRMLRGGFVCADGRLLLASGDEARGAFERMIIQKHAAREKTQPRTENVPEPVREQTQEPDVPAEAARAWPERRWPPPPCWPQAEYAQGCWQE